MSRPYRAIGRDVYHGAAFVATMSSNAEAAEVVERLNALYAEEINR